MTRFPACLAAVALAAAASFCPAKTLRWSSQGDFMGADPHAANEGLTNTINGQVYDGLVMRGRHGEIVPALATHWERTAPERWIFHLRDGVRFHDGSEFTADDVVFSFARMRQTAGYRSFVMAVGDVRRIDSHAVEFRTPGPNPVMLDWLAESLFIMSRAWCERHGAELPRQLTQARRTYADDHAMGTGAFRLVSRTPDVRSVFRKNPQWWGIEAGLFDGNVDEIEFVPIKSDTTRMAALASGTIDFVLDPPPQDVERLRRDPTVRLYEVPENRVVYLSMDQARDEPLYADVKGRNPFKDRRVRQAIYHAIDIETMRRSVMRGFSVPAGLLLSGATPGLPDAPEPRHRFDPDAARRLLAEAGYPRGFGVVLDCPNNRLVNDEKICVAIAAMLAKVGIRIEVRAAPRPLFFARVTRDRDATFWLFSASGADPLFILVPNMHSRNANGDGSINFGGYADVELDRLIDAARIEMDVRRRTALVAAALKRHRENLYDIPLHRQVIVWAARANVEAVPRSDNWLQVSWVRMR